jgi:hypothetical protein
VLIAGNQVAGQQGIFKVGRELIRRNFHAVYGDWLCIG